MKKLLLLVMILASYGCRRDSNPTLAIENQKQLSIIADSDFQSAFRLEPQCNGIVLINDGASDADFVLNMSISERAILWSLKWPHDIKQNSVAAGVGGFGWRPTMGEVAKDICLTIWEDIHRPYPVNPGGDVRDSH